MSSFVFIYLCFNVYKTSNNSHFFRIEHCKYTVREKQQFQKNFIMCLNRLISCISHQLIYKFLNIFMLAGK